MPVEADAFFWNYPLTALGQVACVALTGIVFRNRFHILLFLASFPILLSLSGFTLNVGNALNTFYGNAVEVSPRFIGLSTPGYQPVTYSKFLLALGFKTSLFWA